MILLINPKTTKSTEINAEYFREPNLGLLYLAAILEDHGIPVEILDLEQFYLLNDSELDYIIENKIQGYSIFGLTTLTNNFSFTLQIIEKIRKLVPQSKIILGGPHASFLYEDILNMDNLINYICVGEAEQSFPKLLSILMNETSIQDLTIAQFESLLRNIKGIAFKNNVGKIEFTGTPDPIDINSLPLPARYKLAHEHYHYRVASIIINRGCPNQCSFCSRQNLFKKPRIRSIQSILAEIRDIISLQNYTYINFYDNININKAFFKDFCDMFLKYNINIPWGCELRVDSMTQEEAISLKQAGCRLVATGIESASPEVLKQNFKYQNPEEVMKGLNYLKQVEIPVQAYFILGLPGETEKTFSQTIRFIKHLPFNVNDRINYFIATPYPGSRLWIERDEFGILIFENDFSKYDCEHVIFQTTELSRDQLEKLYHISKKIESHFQQNSIQ
ncbi:MAG: B12-binding domain-containing radical SAM protein [Promethearchaeota archaeon]